MSILGNVTVTTAKVVKAASLIGMGVVSIFLAESALAIMVSGMGSIGAAELGRELLLFGMGLAGYELADWCESKAMVNDTKAAQAAELARLQGTQMSR